MAYQLKNAKLFLKKKFYKKFLGERIDPFLNLSPFGRGTPFGTDEIPFQCPSKSGNCPNLGESYKGETPLSLLSLFPYQDI